MNMESDQDMIEVSELESILNDEERLLGEGANTSAYEANNESVIKPIAFEDNVDPFKRANKARDIERFPWVTIEERNVDGPFNYATVVMERSDLDHEAAVNRFGVEEVIKQDLDMFLELFDSGVLYKDFKPDNLGYFEAEDGESENYFAQPIDLIEPNSLSNPWEKVDEPDLNQIVKYIDIYVGSHDLNSEALNSEDGVTDIYDINLREAQEIIMDYFNLNTDSFEINQDPYSDFTRAFNENQILDSSDLISCSDCNQS